MREVTFAGHGLKEGGGGLMYYLYYKDLVTIFVQN